MRHCRFPVAVACIVIVAASLSMPLHAQDHVNAGPRFFQFILQIQQRQLDKGIEASPKADPTSGELISSIDLLVDNQNHDFSSTTQFDKHKLQVSGTVLQIDPLSTDQYRVKIRYEDKTADGAISLSSTVELKWGEPFTLMGAKGGRFITVCLKDRDHKQP